MSEFAMFASLTVLMAAGFILGEMFAVTGVFEGKPDFALFFFGLAGFFIWDLLSAAVGFNMVVPVGVVMWGAVLSLFSSENACGANSLPDLNEIAEQ